MLDIGCIAPKAGDDCGLNIEGFENYVNFFFYG